MGRFLLIGVGLLCVTMCALVVFSPWWRRLALGLVALFFARNVAMTPQPKSEEPAEDVIEGEFRIIDNE